MELFSFLVYSLATWRISSLFVNEGGPGNMFLYIREWSGIEHDSDGNKTIIPDGFFPSLLSCIWCSSLWVALFWVVMDWVLPEITLRVAMVFAISAVAILLHKKSIEN